METEPDDTEPNFPLYIELARMTGNDDAADFLECYFSDTYRLAHNFLSLDRETENDPPIETLQRRSTLYRAGRLFMAIYDGSYIRLNEEWDFQEIMPDQFMQLPVSILRSATTRLSSEHLQRIREQAAWEIQSLMAGVAAELIDDDPLDLNAERLLEAFWPLPPGWSVVPRVHAIITGHEEGRTKDFSLQCAAECFSILNDHWNVVSAIDPEVGTTPDLSKLIRSTGVQGKRFASNSPNSVLFDVFRSEIAPKTMWARPFQFDQ